MFALPPASRTGKLQPRTPFAWRNLTHRKVRSVVALSGVCFSVLLIFMESGFYSAVLASATAVYRAMDADIFLISPQYVFLGRSGTIPRQRVFQAESVPGVQQATAFYVDEQLWRNPVNRLRYLMLVMGFDPARDPLKLSAASRIVPEGQILIDSLSRPHFGPQTTGTRSDIGDYPVEVAGQYRIGPGFGTDGAAVMSDDTFIRLFKNRSIDSASIGVVRVAPGAAVSDIVSALRRALPADVRIVTRDEMIQREEDFWAVQTAIGPVFALGAALGVVIGVVILYQVMATDIANRIHEYATLMALGYDSKSLKWIVFEEVSVFALAGFGAGWVISAGLYKVVRDQTGLAMAMPAGRSLFAFILTLFMCWVGGLLASRKLHRADPAALF